VAVDGGKQSGTSPALLRMEGSLPIQNPSGVAGITRRRFILAASASVICAPVIVRAASLMPVRAVGPIGPQYYGWVERTFIHCLTPHLSELSRAGMWPYGIAAELNRRKRRSLGSGLGHFRHEPLMKILAPNWRNCPPFKPFLGISHHARTRMT